MSNFLTIVLAVFLILVVLPFILFIVVVITQRRRLARMMLADEGDLDRELKKLWSENHQSSEELIAQKVVNSASIMTAMFGLLTGVGGVFTIPMFLTIDTAATLRRQMRMVQLIFALYNNQRSTDEYLILVLGGSSAGKILLKIFLRVIIKLPWEIPLIGGLICALINYFVTQSIGKAAIARARGERIRLGAIAANIVQETKQKARDALPR